MKVSKYFWAKDVHTTSFLFNRMSFFILSGQIPFHTLHLDKSLFFIELKIFGCACFVRNVRSQVTKLDPKPVKCIFLGYYRNWKGYRCFYPSLGRYVISMDVTFHENPPFSLGLSYHSHGESGDILIYIQFRHIPLIC